MFRSRKLLLALLSVALLLLGVSHAFAAAGSNPIISPDAKIQGLTYGDWAGEWWKYFVSLSREVNPTWGGDVVGCIVHMEGSVGLVGANPNYTATAGNAQDCGAVPRDSMLFVPIVNVECSTVEAYPFYGANAGQLKQCVQDFQISGKNLSVSLDGADLKVGDDNVVVSKMYQFSFPAVNVLFVPGPGAGNSVAKGGHVMFAPLAPGTHTIHIKGTETNPSFDPNFSFTAEETLTVTVQ